MELLKVDTVAQAREKLLALARPLFLRHETIPIEDAQNRILATDIVSSDNVPGFTRSTVDRHAVIASDTAGAGESIPVVLTSAGAVEMGRPATDSVSNGITHGRCAYIPTGGMLPDGADSVVMVEQSEVFSDRSVGIYGAVARGENVVNAGDDIKADEVVLAAQASPSAASDIAFEASLAACFQASLATVPQASLIATPIHTKSGLISKLAQTDGYLWIDRNTEGLCAGDVVAVHRFTM